MVRDEIGATDHPEMYVGTGSWINASDSLVITVFGIPKRDSKQYLPVQQRPLPALHFLWHFINLSLLTL